MNCVIARRRERGMRRRGAAMPCLGLWVAVLATLALNAPAAAEATSFTFELDEPGQVSAAIYDGDGRLVRELLRGAERDAGRHTLHWDGLDRAGEPQPTGDYEWRVLATPGFQARYITSLGINPGSAPYDKWVGNHGGGVASVAVDDTGLYASAQLTETAPVLIKQSLDGRERHWTRGRRDVTWGRLQGGVSLASDQQGRLYMLQRNAFVQVIDVETGQPVGRRDRPWDLLPEDLERESDGRLYDAGYDHQPDRTAGIDLAAHGETVVISYRDRDRIKWLDPEDGEVVHQLNVPTPMGVAVASDGTVYVIAERRVLAVSPDGIERVVVDGSLESPQRLAVDPASGDLFIVEGAPRHQVVRFSDDGERLATFGREGGRRQGTYVPTDFLAVTSIAADGAGGFVVAELTPAPRRVAHFDGDGELIDEWYGGQPYFAWGEPDPRDPSKVWFNPGHWLTLAQVNYDTGQWQVLETYELDSLADGLVRPLRGHQGRWRVLYRDDERYLVSTRAPQVLAHEPGELRPVSVTGRRRDMERAVELAGRGEDAESFRWVDADGDGLPQADEFTFSDSAEVPDVDWVADDFAVLGGGSERENEQYAFTLMRTTANWSEHGPWYPIGDEEGVNQIVTRTDVPTRVGYRGRGAYQDRDGNFYAHYLAGHERHGRGWPTRWAGIARLVKWDAEGRERWKVGRSAYHGGFAEHGASPPGDMHVPSGIIGEVGEVVVIGDRVETLAAAWTNDGLYAGSFFDRRADDGLPEVVYHWWRDRDDNEAITASDNANGGRVIVTEDGRVLWFVQGRNSVPVYEVTGWDNWQRRAGTLSLTSEPAHAAGEGRGLSAAYHRGTRITGSPDAERIDEQLWHGIPRGREGNDAVIDGFQYGPIHDWSERVDPLELELDGEAHPGFAVRWTGQIEAPLTEAFVFSVYARGGVRLWLDGKQHVFGWNESTERWETEPIPLQAGQRLDVQLDFYTTQKHPACSLNWESPSIDRERIPTRYLYPHPIETVADVPDVRSARESIPVITFDDQSGDVTHARDGILGGTRQRGIATTGAYLGFHRLDFGDTASTLHVQVGGAPGGVRAEFQVTLEFRIDSPDGPVIATLKLDDENPREQATRTIQLEQPVNGVRDVYIGNATEERWHSLYLTSFWFAR